MKCNQSAPTFIPQDYNVESKDFQKFIRSRHIKRIKRVVLGNTVVQVSQRMVLKCQRISMQELVKVFMGG